MVAISTWRGTVGAAIMVTAAVAGGAPAQSEDVIGKTNRNAAELKSEIDTLQNVIESLHQRTDTLSDTLAAVEARLAEAEGRLTPAADCGEQKHGSVFVGTPVECYYGYLIYQCWNGAIRMVGGECRPATE
jgi:outer membrane murein-binding lipoprotein Lpp